MSENGERVFLTISTLRWDEWIQSSGSCKEQGTTVHTS
jgi:hypothetical protein